MFPFHQYEKITDIMVLCFFPHTPKRKENQEENQAKSPYVIAARGGLSLGAAGLLLPTPKKRLKLIPRPRFFSSTGAGAGTLALLP
jgi:hypothetical protein